MSPVTCLNEDTADGYRFRKPIAALMTGTGHGARAFSPHACGLANGHLPDSSEDSEVRL
jgi:hypothetical protein